MEFHARIEDVPLLCQTILDCLKDEESLAYRLCICVDALANFPNLGRLPAVETVFWEARYSYARTRAAIALSILCPEFFRQNLALPCLWDCLDPTREIGVKMADPSNPAVRARLAELAADSVGDSEVREASRAKLSGWYAGKSPAPDSSLPEA